MSQQTNLTEASFDKASLLDRVEGDTELLAEIVALFLEDSPRLLDDVRHAVAAGDAPALKRAAHTLKGAASNFSAAGVVKASAELEAMGRAGSLAGSVAAKDRLEGELRRFEEALTKLVVHPAAA